MQRLNKTEKNLVDFAQGCGTLDGCYRVTYAKSGMSAKIEIHGRTLAKAGGNGYCRASELLDQLIRAFIPQFPFTGATGVSNVRAKLAEHGYLLTECGYDVFQIEKISQD